MPNQTLSVAGSCRCGRVEFEVTAPPLVTMACHCRGCQKMTGSAYSLSAAIPAKGFHVTRGAPVIGGLHGASRQYFCPRCMSWLFTKPEGLDFIVNVRSTMLEGPSWTEPFIESCTAEKLAWVSTPARYSYEGFPPPDSYEPLIAEFAEQEATFRRG